jgi:hypothetical protein
MTPDYFHHKKCPQKMSTKNACMLTGFEVLHEPGLGDPPIGDRVQRIINKRLEDHLI